MSEVEQVTATPTGHEATVAAIADVLAALGSEAGLVEWADEAPVPSPPPGAPTPASGATISHGPIRLRDSGPPTLSAGTMPVQMPFVVPRAEKIGHGTIRLRTPVEADPAGAPAVPETEPAAVAPLPDLIPADRPEPVGHGTIRLRTPVAAAPEPEAEPDSIAPASAAGPESAEPAPAFDVDPEPLAEVSDAEPEFVAEAAGEEPEFVAEAPELEPEPIAEAPKLEPEPIAEVPEPEPEHIAETYDAEPEELEDPLAGYGRRHILDPTGLDPAETASLARADILEAMAATEA